MNPSDVPQLDDGGADAAPRAVQFRDDPEPGLRRRGFLAVLATGAMTLGMTLLGWIPLARPARAEEGTEYPNCGGYSDGPGGPLCTGAPYSADYCGKDHWFLQGCTSGWGNDHVCYEPFASCYAGGPEARDAWRWVADGVTYRCADGKIYHAGAPNPEFVICSATLTDSSSRAASPEVPLLPSLPSLPAVPSLPALPSLPSLPR